MLPEDVLLGGAQILVTGLGLFFWALFQTFWHLLICLLLVILKILPKTILWRVEFLDLGVFRQGHNFFGLFLTFDFWKKLRFSIIWFGWDLLALADLSPIKNQFRLGIRQVLDSFVLVVDKWLNSIFWENRTRHRNGFFIFLSNFFTFLILDGLFHTFIELLHPISFGFHDLFWARLLFLCVLLRNLDAALHGVKSFLWGCGLFCSPISFRLEVVV